MERDGLRLLDRSGITAELLDSALSDEALEAEIPEAMRGVRLPVPEIRYFDSGGAELAVRIYRGAPDSVHVIYLPAEYDSSFTLGLLAAQYLAGGFTFVSLDYRGCGKSGGEKSLLETLDDLEPYYRFVRKWMGEEDRTGNLVVMGRSIGSALALDLAVRVEKELLCLVLESAFDRTRDYLSAKGIDLSALPEDQPIFTNRDTMKGFSKPVLFIHSPRDTVQSLTQVEWLVAESRSKATQFQLAPSGTREDLAHQVNELYGEVVLQYINLRQGIRPPRKRRQHTRRSSHPSYH